MKKFSVTVNGSVRQVEEGTLLSSLLNVAQPCGGHGNCGKCKVYAKGGLSPVSHEERSFLSPSELESGVRLACQTTVCGPAEINSITPASHEVLTKGVVPLKAVAPFYKKIGLAVDIGTTTIATRLFGEDGVILAEHGEGNPQSKFGADVISRVEFSLSGKGKALQTAVTGAIDEIINVLCEKACRRATEIDGAVITGNTAMLDFLTDTSAEPLSHSPFMITRKFGETVFAETLGLKSLQKGTKIYIPPVISAFLGADAVCVMIATSFGEKESPVLFADIGTNGEMALCSDGEFYACSTAAGPAFEGVGISCGMHGSTGAIDKVSLDGENLITHVIGDSSPKGICGSGLIDAVSCLLESEKLDPTGLLEEDPTSILPPVTLTQGDIRAVQLAKSAISSGMLTLLNEKRLFEKDIKVLYIAGGFGTYLNVLKAGKVGLIPENLTDKVKIIGNGALDGASMLLLDKNLFKKAEDLSSKTKTVDLSKSKTFSELFIENMVFPEE